MKLDSTNYIVMFYHNAHGGKDCAGLPSYLNTFWWPELALPLTVVCVCVLCVCLDLNRTL